MKLFCTALRVQIHKTEIYGINKQLENKGCGEGKKKNVVNSRIKICSLRSAAHSVFSLLTLCSSVEPFHAGLFSEIGGQAWKCVEASLCLDVGRGEKIHYSGCNRGSLTGNSES